MDDLEACKPIVSAVSPNLTRPQTSRPQGSLISHSDILDFATMLDLSKRPSYFRKHTVSTTKVSMKKSLVQSSKDKRKA